MPHTQDEFKTNKIDLKHINPSILRGDKLYHSLLPPKNAVFIGDFPVEIHQPPAISGPKTIVSTLTCFPGVYKGRPYPDITYQWYSDGIALPGETNNTLVTYNALWRTDVHCTVVASNTVDEILHTISNDSNIIVPTFPVNAADDYFEGDWDAPFTSHDLLLNDGMGEGVDYVTGFELLTDTLTGDPTGTITYNNDGTLTYSAGDFTESGSTFTIDYRITDSDNETDTGTISFKVLGVWVYITQIYLHSVTRGISYVDFTNINANTLLSTMNDVSVTKITAKTLVNHNNTGAELTNIRAYSLYTE